MGGGPTGDGVIQSLSTGAWQQQWRIAPAKGGGFTITNRNSGKLVDVAYASTAEAADVIQWSYNGNANQRWVITAV